ncbi:diguanylate cyclase [Flavimaricola marinus]|uniref:diguanylate cyclase n=1 Tax=Flavimaricola marinus TaxID=1819565 RepID=A0A238LE96_9RHOB|nr:diguanylate cyclase [Flavimaricola marinus]SMY07912.1 Response regulator PleD [Flavimaricola marinus]
MKDEKERRSTSASRPSWDAGAESDSSGAATLATEIMNIMEQGIVVWSGDGYCELHNTRVYQVLELSGDDLQIGTLRADFRQKAVDRGDMSAEDRAYSDGKVQAHQPYAFDRHLPSGRVVLTSGRPTRGGGYVVTFTDVTEARQVARDLAEAKLAAEAAQTQALEILEEERARQAEAHMLSQLDEWLQSCKTLEELFEIVQRFMARLLPGGAGELYVYSNSRDVLDGVCQWNTEAMLPHINADNCWSLRRGRAYEFQRGELCFACEHVQQQAHDDDPAHYLCIPIVAHGDTVGMLHIRFLEANVPSGGVSDRMHFAARCGEHISMAIANVKLRDELRDQSIRDPLTGLFNRRYFMDAMRREVSVASRKGASFGLISFDVDKFKNFNDNHGHDAGDMVLRSIGQVLSDVIGAADVPCRMGGEEFAILMPGADAQAASKLAEALREAMPELRVRYLDSILPPINISAGVAAYPDSGLTPPVLLRRADEALYLAKAEGRNCVRCAE